MVNPSIQLYGGLDYDDYNLVLCFCYVDEVPDYLKQYAEPDLNETVYAAKSDDLKALLKADGLKVSGNKTDLIERVKENIPKDVILSTLRNVAKFDRNLVRTAKAVEKMQFSFESMDVKATGTSFEGSRTEPSN